MMFAKLNKKKRIGKLVKLQYEYCQLKSCAYSPLWSGATVDYKMTMHHMYCKITLSGFKFIFSLLEYKNYKLALVHNLAHFFRQVCHVGIIHSYIQT